MVTWCDSTVWGGGGLRKGCRLQRNVQIYKRKNSIFLGWRGGVALGVVARRIFYGNRKLIYDKNWLAFGLPICEETFDTKYRRYLKRYDCLLQHTYFEFATLWSIVIKTQLVIWGAIIVPITEQRSHSISIIYRPRNV